jgi:hypothetical protein
MMLLTRRLSVYVKILLIAPDVEVKYEYVRVLDE